MSSLVQPLNIFRSKKNEKPYYMTMYSNIEKMITLPKPTTLSKKADDFIMETLGDETFFRKKFVVAVCREPETPVAMLDVVMYNIPLLLEKGYNMNVLSSDDEDDKLRTLENKFIASITDKDSMPDSSILNPSRPVVYFRAISVIPKERRQGIGTYLFEHAGDYLKGVFGIDYGAIFAPAGYSFITNSEIIETKDIDKFIKKQKQIVLQWFLSAGFQEYKNDAQGRFFVKKEA